MDEVFEEKENEFESKLIAVSTLMRSNMRSVMEKERVDSAVRPGISEKKSDH